MIGKSDIKFNYSMNNEVILKTLGMQIRQMRLNKNLTQIQLAQSAGVSRSAISQLENKGIGTMNSFVQILRALEKIEILNYFITEAPVSPIQIAKLRGKTRQRASGNVKTAERKEDSEW
jgi:transcriptional regulator with XRE-family HTH domain